MYCLKNIYIFIYKYIIIKYYCTVNFGSKLTIFKLNPTCNASKIILYIHYSMNKKGI